MCDYLCSCKNMCECCENIRKKSNGSEMILCLNNSCGNVWLNNAFIKNIHNDSIKCCMKHKNYNVLTIDAKSGVYGFY